MMSRNTQRAARRAAQLGALVAISLGAWSAHAAGLEEVVARASRSDVAAGQIHLETTMDAYRDRVGAALKSEMRRHITEQARPRLSIAQVGVRQRG